MKKFNAFRPTLSVMEERSLLSATFAALPAEPVGPEFPWHGVLVSTMNSTATGTHSHGGGGGAGKVSMNDFSFAGKLVEGDVVMTVNQLDASGEIIASTDTRTLPSNKLFVGGLSWDTNDEGLR